MDITRLERALGRHPRMVMAHLPTMLERMSNLSEELGLELWVKRDDCTGIGFGGNKVRQLEYYFGVAQRQGADTVLITGAIQSNFIRATAAMAARLGLDCHVQLEESVSDTSDLYRESGNVLLDKLVGATLHSYSNGGKKVGADVALRKIAAKLNDEGRRSYIIPLSADAPPVGALGYVRAALELVEQIGDLDAFDDIVIASGSALTQVGLLYGLRYLGSRTGVYGVCVRRDALSQEIRIRNLLMGLAELLDEPPVVDPPEIRLYEGVLAPGYGQLNTYAHEAIKWAARSEGLYLDPVYTGKSMAGLIQLTMTEQLAGHRVLFWHTGGTPALFGYGDQLV